MKLIVGNWKMYPETLKEAKAIFSKIRRVAPRIRSTIVLCPPKIFFQAFGDGKTKIKLGVQDIALFSGTGAQTGEESAQMMKGGGASYVIVGHSERRIHGETEESIAKKVEYAIDAGLTVILCVGEKERDLEAGYFSVIRGQLRSALEHLSSGKAKSLVVAYEPVWAIGSKAKAAATPDVVREMTVYIRKELATLFGKAGRDIPVLYGGSVDEQNANTYLTTSGADGLLIGRVSLEAERFLEIAKNAGTV